MDPSKLPRPSTEWHWEQAIKYAVEGIKTALILNGAAAIALMTFANTHVVTLNGKLALFLFALGAMLAAIAFLFSYRTQVLFGNAELPEAEQYRNTIWRLAQRWNTATVLTLVLSIVVFLAGAFLGAFTITN